MDRYDAEGGFETKDPTETGGNANRTSTVRAEMKYPQPQRGCDARAATASTRRQVRVPRIAGHAREWTVRDSLPAELRRRCLS